MRGLADSSELQAENARLKAEIAGRDASPFLGQRSLGKRVEQALHAEFIRHNDGPVAAMEELLRAYPAVSIAFLASLARTRTGQDGHNAFYRHLEEALGVDETSYDMRRRLWRAFRAACIRLGLPIPNVAELLEAGKDRYRLEYFVQAGPLNCDLPSLADAFIAVREQSGDFDPQDPAACRNALDAARAELGEGSRTLQRVLANDRGAWHASAFARLSRGEPPRDPFEEDFLKAIDAARLIRRTLRSGRRPASPRLVFSEGGVALRSPPMAGWNWSVAGPWNSEVIVGPDQDLPLGGVGSVRWMAVSIETARDAVAPVQMELVVWGDARFLIFETGTGGLLARVAGESCSIGAEAVDVVSRTPFRLCGATDEQASEETVEGLHVARLSAGQAVAQSPQGAVTLTLLARPTLSWGEENATTLQGRPVFGAKGFSLKLQLPEEEQQDWTGRIEAVVTVGRREAIVRHRLPLVEADGHLVASLRDVAIDSLERLEGRISFIAEERPLLQAPEAWLWPGLQKVDDGRFIGPVPKNFNPTASRNAALGGEGVVAGTGDGRLAELAFGHGEGLLRILVQTGQVQVELVDRGVARMLEPGATIIDDGSPKQLRIWCSDRTAALDLCGVVEREPFRGAGRRSVSLAGLASRNGSRRIEMWPGGDRRLAYNLALLTRPAEPESIRIELVGGAPRGEVSVSSGAVFCGGARRLGGNDRLEAAPGEGFVTQVGPASVVFRLSPRHFQDGVWLVELCERHEAEEAVRPMRTSRGDRHAVLCGSLDGQLGKADFVATELIAQGEDRAAFFLDVNEALMTPWSRESWEDGGLKTLEAMWWTHGRALAREAAGIKVLATAMGAAPPADSSPSWIPLRHPFELADGLYSGDLNMLAALLADVDNADVREFARWLNRAELAEGGRVPGHRREACLRFIDRLAAAAAGSVEGATNADRTANASRLVHAVPLDHESRRADEAELGDVSERFAIMARVPDFFAAFARSARQNDMAGFLASLDRAAPGAVRDLGYLLRLGPELLALSLRDADFTMGPAT